MLRSSSLAPSTGNMYIPLYSYNVGPPNVISWFIAPSNYGYNYHNPKREILVMFTNGSRYRLGAPLIVAPGLPLGPHIHQIIDMDSLSAPKNRMFR